MSSVVESDLQFKSVYKNRKRETCLEGFPLLHNNQGDELCNRTHNQHLTRMRYTTSNLKSQYFSTIYYVFVVLFRKNI